MIEATLSVRVPELWVCQITEKYDVEVSCKVGGSRAKAAGWCLTEVRGKDDLLDRIVDEIRTHPSVGGAIVQSREVGKVTMMVDIRRCQTCQALMNSRHFLTYPVEIKHGFMTWIMITDNNLTLGKICEKLEGTGCVVKVLRVVPLEEQKKLLTERQEKVISVAFEKGYFDNPKRSDSHTIASELGISAATFSEIIRAAQRRILRELLRKWQTEQSQRS